MDVVFVVVPKLSLQFDLEAGVPRPLVASIDLGPTHAAG
jgi:hypothetical protein